MTEDDLLQQVQEDLDCSSTIEAKEAFAKFVPNSKRVYGVRLPIINELSKKYRSGGFPLIQKLWESGVFEEQMLAIKLLNKNCKKDPDLTLNLLDTYKIDVDNWAICDTLCSEGIRPILKVKSKEIWGLAQSYLTSKEMWVRRMGIVMLIHFAKIPERKEEVRTLVAPLSNDKEHYIKKAMTWITRYLDK